MPGTLKRPLLHGRFRMHRARAVFCLPRRSTKAGSGTLSATASSSRDDGDALIRDYIDHPGAVAVLPMNDAGEVLLIKQYRHPVGMDLWEIPAGLLDVEGEDFVVGAARELAEEADLVAGHLERPGRLLQFTRILQRSHPHLPRPRPHRSAAPRRHERTDEEAEIEFHWIPLDEAVARCLAGRLHNPSAVVGILAAAAARADGFAGLRPADAPWPAHPSQR